MEVADKNYLEKYVKYKLQYLTVKHDLLYGGGLASALSSVLLGQVFEKLNISNPEMKQVLTKLVNFDIKNKDEIAKLLVVYNNGVVVIENGIPKLTPTMITLIDTISVKLGGNKNMKELLNLLFSNI